MAAPAPEQKTKPTKPDEQAFRANLANAEKEHAASQEKLVCLLCTSYRYSLAAIWTL